MGIIWPEVSLRDSSSTVPQCKATAQSPWRVLVDRACLEAMYIGLILVKTITDFIGNAYCSFETRANYEGLFLDLQFVGILILEPPFIIEDFAGRSTTERKKEVPFASLQPNGPRRTSA
jgi:hypothetical protein